MRRKVLKNKYYVHIDSKKKSIDYEDKVRDEKWVKAHGFYPFIHYKMIFKKYVLDERKNKIKKIRLEIYIMLHIRIDLYMNIMEIS